MSNYLDDGFLLKINKTFEMEREAYAGKNLSLSTFMEYDTLNIHSFDPNLRQIDYCYFTIFQKWME